MKRPPVIIVQIIHILGPSKGEIQEFNEPIISIGRHASCHVRFPVGLTSVSRKHAEIIRDGNQFKLVDHSTNGTFVNGKKIKEAFLKNGDVLAFAEGGPKVSFLTQVKEGVPEVESAPAQKPREELPKPPEHEPPMVHREPTAARREPPPVHREPKKPETISPEARRPQVAPPEIEEREEVPLQPVKAPLVIQYGPTLRSFKELPVTIGKGPKCHFIIDHPAIFDQHAQIFFSKEQYWVKDLTGQGLVLINRKPAGFQAFLKPNDLLAMSPRGPVFRYLGEGRLAETEEPDLQPPSPSAESAQKGPREETPGGKETQKPSSVFKKFFRS